MSFFAAWRSADRLAESRSGRPVTPYFQRNLAAKLRGPPIDIWFRDGIMFCFK